MKYKKSLAEWIGRKKYYYFAFFSDNNYHICDYCKFRRGTRPSKDKQGRLVAELVLCEKCFKAKQKQ